MIKIAIDAGHYMLAPGKRCAKSLDPNETREWWLNNRIACLVQEILYVNYPDVRVFRCDDEWGDQSTPMARRIAVADDNNVDWLISIHHNAGAKLTSSGGIVVYACSHADEKTYEYQKHIYNKLVQLTGLKGNRSNPTPKKCYGILHKSKSRAVLLELGFMDSKTDVPIILTDEYAANCADAIVQSIAEIFGLKRADNSTYVVEVGRFKSKEEADKHVAKLHGYGWVGAYARKE